MNLFLVFMRSFFVVLLFICFLETLLNHFVFAEFVGHHLGTYL